MDLFDFDTSGQTATMQIRHPVTGEALATDKDEPIEITLFSADSPQYEEALHEAQRAAARVAAQSEGIPDPAGITKRSIQVLARAITGWRNIILKGETLPFNHQNAVRLLTEVRFIREQVSRFVSNRANFLAETREKS